MELITWKKLGMQFKQPENLYQLGQKIGHDFLTTEQCAKITQHNRAQLMKLQTNFARQRSKYLPDNATLVGMFIGQRVFYYQDLLPTNKTAEPEVILASYEPATAPYFSPWSVLIYNQITHQKKLGVSELDYEEVFKRPVAISGNDDLIAGLAAIIVEITKFGIEIQARQKAQAEFTLAQEQVENKMQSFIYTTQMVARFFDEYIPKHPDDPRLPDEVAKFWPLTTGIMSPLEPDNPNSPLISTLAIDEQLFAEFRIRFGAAWRKFLN